MSERVKVHFGAFGQSIEFVDCAEMAIGFRSILRGWDLSSDPAADANAPAISFVRQNGRIAWVAGRPMPHYWKEHPPRTEAQAVCDFHYYLANWFCRERPELFALHSAAVEFAEGLVVFPGVSRAGKSTLSAELARQGQLVFCDDVLPLKAGSHEGLALGILPRLRLPLPGTLPPAFRAFLDERRGLSRDRWVYVALRDGEIAPFGRTQRVCAAVSLSRSEKPVPATLRPLPVETTLKHLLEQNFADRIPSVAMFEDLHDLALKARRFELRYSDLDEASSLLTKEFGSMRKAAPVVSAA